jgi:hypothetical protein
MQQGNSRMAWGNGGSGGAVKKSGGEVPADSRCGGAVLGQGRIQQDNSGMRQGNGRERRGSGGPWRGSRLRWLQQWEAMGERQEAGGSNTGLGWRSLSKRKCAKCKPWHQNWCHKYSAEGESKNIIHQVKRSSCCQMET